MRSFNYNKKQQEQIKKANEWKPEQIKLLFQFAVFIIVVLLCNYYENPTLLERIFIGLLWIYNLLSFKEITQEYANTN
jgi:hypothetical protein